MRALTRALLVAAGLLVLALAFAWSQREPLARDTIDKELARRGVPASYTLTRLGVRWQRIENVRLGDPARPDLTADWAEVRLTAGLGGVGVSAIRAGGVTLRGRLVDGTLRLGALDKLLPPPSGKPFTLPDLDVDLSDARLRLETDYGVAAFGLSGRGNLADGFRGRLAALMPVLTRGQCRADRVTALVELRVRDRRPSLAGPVRANSVDCGVAVSRPAIALDVTLGEALDTWNGQARVEAERAEADALRFAGLGGRLTFTGGARGTSGRLDMRARQGALGANRAAGLRLDGRFTTGDESALDGRFSVVSSAVDPALARAITGAAGASGGTPVAPLLARLAQAADKAGRSLALDADFAVSSGRDGWSGQARRIVAVARSGAALRLEGGEGIRFGADGLVADTKLRLGGGGLPDIDATLVRLANGETRGLARVAPYRAGDAALALSPVRYAATPAGAMRVESVATLDGPLGDGRVEGLRVPLTVLVGSRGSIALNARCTPVVWRALSLSGLALQPARLELCPVGSSLVRRDARGLSGGATIAAPSLSGRLGSSPLTLSATGARLTLGNGGFAVEGLAARLGSAARQSRLEIGRLTGRIASGAVIGRFAATSGQIGNVPLLIGDGEGDWTLRAGVLTLGGAVTVADEEALPRFQPLLGEEVKLRLAGGRVTVTGVLRAPASRTRVADVAIAHDLPSGRGRATLDVPGIAFGRALQPEALTRLTLGVVANVQGSIAGRGEIDWSPRGVTSTGQFGTQGLDLAAAFGPVTGLKGELAFTDLLALETAPSQRVTIASVNPGIAVTDGALTFQLLRDQRLAVAGGRWPFAGGELLLDPTTIDLGQPVARRLTFRVVALDAARFIQQLEFENLAATGIFDGTLPMVFDENGGRIEGGSVVARRGGGTVAYVGEVSNAAMPVYGKLAFDALKSLRYRNLGIELDGALDGEMVSRINFNGVNTRAVEPDDGFLVRKFIGLPFIFNVTIRAPFRGLLSSARGFQDPTLLLRRAELPVQPIESDDTP